jgi:hypothetical protein
LAVAVITVASILLESVPVLSAHPLLAESPANANWHIASENEIVLLAPPEGRAPMLILRNEALVGRVVQLTIESDAREYGFSSGETRAAVPGKRGKPITVSIDRSKETPRVLIDNQDIPAQRGTWIQIFKDAEWTCPRLVGALT